MMFLLLSLSAPSQGADADGATAVARRSGAQRRQNDFLHLGGDRVCPLAHRRFRSQVPVYQDRHFSLDPRQNLQPHEHRAADQHLRRRCGQRRRIRDLSHAEKRLSSAIQVAQCRGLSRGVQRPQRLLDRSLRQPDRHGVQHQSSQTRRVAETLGGLAPSALEGTHGARPERRSLVCQHALFHGREERAWSSCRHWRSKRSRSAAAAR